MDASTQKLICICCKIVLRERSTGETKTPKLNNVNKQPNKTLPKPNHFSLWIWGYQSSIPECLGKNCRWFCGAQIRKGLAQALLCWFWVAHQWLSLFQHSQVHWWCQRPGGLQVWGCSHWWNDEPAAVSWSSTCAGRRRKRGKARKQRWTNFSGGPLGSAEWNQVAWPMAFIKPIL